MQLTKHFSLEEMIASQSAGRLGIDNTPTPDIVANLTRTAKIMELVRAVLGWPIHVDSGFRSPELNKAIGGVETSAHCKGLACDFICPAFGTPYQVAQMLDDRVKDFDIDQLILEYGWVHIGLTIGMPRNELLTKRSASSPYEEGINA